MFALSFDWSLSVGTILTMLTCIGSTGLFFVALAGRLARMEFKIDTVWNWWLDQETGGRRNGDRAIDALKARAEKWRAEHGD